MVTEVTITLANGVTITFTSVTSYSNDDAKITFNGQKEGDDEVKAHTFYVANIAGVTTATE